MIISGDTWLFDNWKLMNEISHNGEYYLMSTSFVRGDIIIRTDPRTTLMAVGIVDKVTTIGIDVSLLNYKPHSGVTVLEKHTIYDINELELSPEDDSKELFAAELLKL